MHAVARIAYCSYVRTFVFDACYAALQARTPGSFDAVKPHLHAPDGDRSTFNAEELADIVAVWRAVAEDFAPFDVDVTTVDPGDAALAGVG
ncbi:hypothetical protein COO60DRAFT_1635476 [Scenedesmus sp. NREL 46B-D3]|nr:hypothetical protein COO60DRAFT_1635476 [Scenedesmus sp. NREL 46B-D3]